MDVAPAVLTNSQDWQNLLINILVPVFSAIGIYLANLVREYFSAKIAAIKDKRLRESIEFAMKSLDKTAETVVKEIGQTMVNRTATGKVLQPKALRVEALQRVQNRLPSEMMGMLEKTYGSQLTPIIVGKIESKIKEC